MRFRVLHLAKIMKGSSLLNTNRAAPHAQIIEEVAPVEQPLTEIIEEVTLVISSPPRDRVISPTVELMFQTPPVTKSMPE